MSSFELDHELS